MNTITIAKPHLLSKLPVWNPKWSTKYAELYGEPVALVHKRKVDFGSGIILVEFTKSPALKGQRFCMLKHDMQKYPVTTNGVAPMYEIPLSHFSTWQTQQEVYSIAMGVFND